MFASLILYDYIILYWVRLEKAGCSTRHFPLHPSTTSLSAAMLCKLECQRFSFSFFPLNPPLYQQQCLLCSEFFHNNISWWHWTHNTYPSYVVNRHFIYQPSKVQIIWLAVTETAFKFHRIHSLIFVPIYCSKFKIPMTKHLLNKFDFWKIRT